jgi:hypothetical protein
VEKKGDSGMTAKKKGLKRRAGPAAQNAAIDTTETVAKVSAGVTGAAAIGVAKGLGRAIWRGFRPRR